MHLVNDSIRVLNYLYSKYIGMHFLIFGIKFRETDTK